MNGAQRHIALLFVAGFLGVTALVLVANAESTISDLSSAGQSVPDHLVWSWEWSSILGWLSIYPLLWWGVLRFKPPRTSWPMAMLLLAVGSVIASAWHIAAMVALRQLYYAATGAGPYRFFSEAGDPLLYEYRKDLTTYVQFVAIAALVQWMLARAADGPATGASPPAGSRFLEIAEGPVRHSIPVDEIDAVRSAANYVEVDWAGRTLLHRATLKAIADELGDAFVQIHRGQIVRRDAIRRIESDRSGDFTITLENGREAKGSRRYRDALL